MDELALAEYQRRMSAQVCREIIRQSQEHEQEMETKAQKLWEYAHKQLVTFLRTMDMDYGEACDRGGRPLDSFRDEDLAYLIHVRLKALMNKSDGREQTTGLDAARQQLRGLNKDFSDLQLKNIELMASNTKVQKENEKLARQLTSLLEEICRRWIKVIREFNS
jgi:DNA repair exonuclease SbcCD ATPase subunit